jgi:divalent metal cation (Fe/Co/Zn/Cd) transporter
VDPLAGAFVAVLIFRTGLFILRESSTDLMAIIPSRDLAQQIVDLLKTIDGVSQLEELQAHRFGPHIVLNLTIGIDGTLTVYEGDQIASCVEEALVRSVPNVRRVHVHYHPAEADHADMTIDEILEPVRKYGTPHHPEFYE